MNYTGYQPYPNQVTVDRLSQSMMTPQSQQGNYYMPQQPQTQNYSSNTNITFVNGIEGAKGLQLPPNSSQLMMDSDSTMFYVKSTDNLGIAKISAYTFTEVDLNDLGRVVKREEVPPQVTLEDYNKLLSKVEELDKFKQLAEDKLASLME